MSDDLLTPARQQRLRDLLAGDDALTPGELTGLVQQTIDRAPLLLRSARRFGTPQYLLHEDLLVGQAQRFEAAFTGRGPDVRVHYAFKANPSAAVVACLERAGVSADVSSGLELDLALAVGFRHIVFSGPAKSDAELACAVAHADRVTVHLDSFAELERLERAARAAGRVVRAGARLSLAAHGAWTKFGLPAAALPDMVERADACRHVSLQGVQFHLSWQRSGRGYAATLAEVGPLLAARRPAAGWRFVDVGGGFYPEDDEAVYPWLTARGRLLALLDGEASSGPAPDWDGRYLLHRVESVEAVAAEVVDAFRRHVGDSAQLWLEPGRYLVNPSVTVLLSVADVKSAGVAVTDGGTNLLGWERLETEHVPLVNLTRPAHTQRRGNVYGSLCTPHDLWGYTCYGSDLIAGDVLALPAQGAYVQTLAQRFIKPVCQTVVARPDGSLHLAAAAETFADRYPELRQDPRADPLRA